MRTNQQTQFDAINTFQERKHEFYRRGKPIDILEVVRFLLEISEVKNPAESQS